MERRISVGIFRPKYADHLRRWSRIFRREETEMNLFNWIPTEISGIFGKMESTLSRIFPSLSCGTFGHVTFRPIPRERKYLMYKTTNEIRNHRVGERAIAQPLELQMMWIICEFCHWKVTKWRSSDPLWNSYIPRETWIFFGINARVYTKKIQVSRGIFHGIPLESDRRCLTCRNGQITEDVRKIRFHFPTGCQTCFRRIGRTSGDILFKQ